MKFRALNIDYHADALLQWQEVETTKDNNDTNPKPCWIFRAGYYEKLKQKTYGTAEPDNTNAAADSAMRQQSVYDNVPLLNVEEAQKRNKKEICIQICSKDDTNRLNAYTADGKALIGDGQRNWIRSDSNNSIQQPKIKKKHNSKLMTEVDIQNLIYYVNRCSTTLRITNEPWWWFCMTAQKNSRHGRCDNVAATIQTPCVVTPWSSQHLVIQNMDDIIKSLHPYIRLERKKPIWYRTKTFNLLQCFRNKGNFGRWRVKKQDSSDQDQPDSCAIVLYKPPNKRITPSLKQISLEQLIWVVMMIVRAWKQNQNNTHTSYDCQSQVEADKRGSDCYHKKALQHRKADECTTASIQHVTFADTVGYNIKTSVQPSTELQIKSCFDLQQCETNRKSEQDVVNISFDDIIGCTEMDKKCNIEKRASNNKQADAEPNTNDTSKKKISHKRTAEEKAAYKRDRKLQKKEHRRRDKKRKVEEEVDLSQGESIKHQNKFSCSEGSMLQSDKNFEEACVLPRSVVQKMPSSSRSVTVEKKQIYEELDKVRTVFNKNSQENRNEAFAQIKLQRNLIENYIGASHKEKQFDQRVSLQGTIKPMGRRNSLPMSRSRAVVQGHDVVRFQRQEKAASQSPKSTATVAQSSEQQPIVRGRDKAQIVSRNEAKSACTPTTSLISSADHQNSGETTYQSRPIACRQSKTQSPPTLTFLCSEAFLESSGQIVEELATGHWERVGVKATATFIQQSKIEARAIKLIDTPLVDVSGVDIEGPFRSALLVVLLSDLEEVFKAKEKVMEIANLAAIGRYTKLYVILSYDAIVTVAIAKYVTHLQSAVLPSQNESQQTRVFIKTSSPTTLSTAIAESLINLSSLPIGTSDLELSTMEGATDAHTQERAHFLLLLIPMLSVRGAIQILLLSKKILPKGSPYFRLLFQNQRLRQQIMLAASSDNQYTEVNPESLVFLSHLLLAGTNPRTKVAS